MNDSCCILFWNFSLRFFHVWIQLSCICTEYSFLCSHVIISHSHPSPHFGQTLTRKNNSNIIITITAIHARTHKNLPKIFIFLSFGLLYQIWKKHKLNWKKNRWKIKIIDNLHIFISTSRNKKSREIFETKEPEWKQQLQQQIS